MKKKCQIKKNFTNSNFCQAFFFAFVVVVFAVVDDFLDERRYSVT